MKAKKVYGKHERTTVRFTIEVSGTSSAVYDFGQFLNSSAAFADHGVDTMLVRSELMPKREEPRV